MAEGAGQHVVGRMVAGFSGHQKRKKAEERYPAAEDVFMSGTRRVGATAAFIPSERNSGAPPTNRRVGLSAARAEAGPGSPTGQGARPGAALPLPARSLHTWVHTGLPPPPPRRRGRGDEEATEKSHRDEMRTLSLVGKNPPASSKSRKPTQR